jgi:hypothetical protein
MFGRMRSRSHCLGSLLALVKDFRAAWGEGDLRGVKTAGQGRAAASFSAGRFACAAGGAALTVPFDNEEPRTD